MKTLKIGVFLLALLLAAMAMVPIVSAENQFTEQNLQSNLGLITTPKINSHNLLDEFGIQKSEIVENNVPLKGYNETKSVVDYIMKKAKLSDDPKSIIGLYDFGDSQVLLINRGDTVFEVTYDGTSINTYSISPKLLGEKKTSSTPEILITTGTNSDKNTITSESIDRLYSFSIQSPKSPSGILTTYVVTKSRTDNYVIYGTIRASVTAYGVFYVNYGSSITSITNGSSYYTVSPYANCGFSSSTSGVGSTSGQVNAHLKSGLLYARIQMDNWVSCDAWLTTNDGGSQSTWISGYPDNCSG